MATMFWAMACAFLGTPDTALAAGDDYLKEATASGATWAYSWALWTRGLTELRHGDTVRSIELFCESLARQRDIGDRWGPAWGSEALAWAVAAMGHHRRAAEILGTARSLREATGVGLLAVRPFHDAHTETVELVRRALGPQAYSAALEHGATMENAVFRPCSPVGAQVGEHRVETDTSGSTGWS